MRPDSTVSRIPTSWGASSHIVLDSEENQMPHSTIASSFLDLDAEARGKVEFSVPSDTGGFDDEEQEARRFKVHTTTRRSVLTRTPGKEPELTFLFKPPADSTRLVKSMVVSLPVGYEIVRNETDQGCEVLWEGHPRAVGVGPDDISLTNNDQVSITVCQVLDDGVSDDTDMDTSGDAKRRAKLSLELNVLKDQVPDTNKWWYFSLKVWLPHMSPEKEDNNFMLQWKQAQPTAVYGTMVFPSWSVLGDWDCLYTDWSGWGTCSARCGGGLQRTWRRVLVEPPRDGTGLECDEPVARDLPCNEHSCSFPCSSMEEVIGECSAVCGGGVRAVRHRWEGDNCPSSEDVDATQFLPCNTQPCSTGCVLADQWTAVTECSEQCNWGHFWMMRQVLKKPLNDHACGPEWKSAWCMKQPCSHSFTVVRPDRNLLAVAGDIYNVGIAFNISSGVRQVILAAPAGFKFRDDDQHLEECSVTLSDLPIELYSGCSMASDNQIILDFRMPGLPGSRQYSFEVKVLNRDCNWDESGGWYTDLLGSIVKCFIPKDQNQWEIRLAEEESDGDEWRSFLSFGYELYAAPDMAKKLVDSASLPGNDFSAWMTHNTPVNRPTYCSPRINCPDIKNFECSLPMGLCIPRTKPLQASS